LHIQPSSAPFEVKFHAVFICTTTHPFLKASLLFETLCHDFADTSGQEKVKRFIHNACGKMDKTLLFK